MERLTEKRLIEANAIKGEFMFLRKMWSGTEIGAVIDNAPTVDAVEVVRCKDCISGHEQYYGGLVRCNVMGCGGLKPDDFCAYGKRREGE